MIDKISAYLFFIGIFVAFLTFSTCTTNPPEPVNKAPTCSISTPDNNALVGISTSNTISVTANDADGQITQVVISIDNVEEATLLSSPYSYVWNTAGVTLGQHTIKAVVTDDGGLTGIAQITVTITAEFAIVTTADITDITGTTATGGGNVTDDRGVDVTARGLVWGESSSPTIASNTGFTEDGSGTGAFTSSLTGLKVATTYYAKAYATNGQGTAYGEEKSFITAGLPTVVTGAVSDITHESATCAGEVTDNGGTDVSARGLVWSKTNNQVTLEDAEGFTTEGTGTGTFNSSMVLLTRYADYWVRTYATNGAGTAYGNAISFKTLPELPTVVTSDISSIEAHLARGGGEITDDGGDPSVSGGLVWSSIANPNVESYEGYFINSGINPFDTLISGIESETTYYVRAWAQNNGGTYAYGEEKTFTTATFSYTAGSFTDSRDSKVYSTVTISDQTWMAENLAYLPEVCASDAECGYWVYDYQGTVIADAKSSSIYPVYGVLYNWEMAKTSCPTGWHLPSDYDWAYLEVHLGMGITTTVGEGTRGTNQGGKMKETGNVHWDDPNTGATNISGFTALPGGLRVNSSKDFQTIGTAGNFWSSTQEGNFINYRYLNNIDEQVGSDWLSATNNDTSNGGSVRCVKD